MDLPEFPFDPTYGYSREDLQRIAARGDVPADFDAFWRCTYEQACEVPLAIERVEVDSGSPQHRVFEVRFGVWQDLRAGAWLVVPADGTVDLGVVVGHGYGGREAPEYVDYPAACLYPCMPGFDLSAAPRIPSTAARHVLCGIESRDTYILRACVATIWQSVSVLQELCPQVGGRICYRGGSFGGGLGALALPWEPRLRRAHLSVPTFGHHPLRLQCRCTGSGEAVRIHAQHHPEVVEVLRYYDAATAAARVNIPVHVAAALYDPSVPPPGQFAVCNALAGPTERCVLSYGHVEHPERSRQDAVVARRVEAFLVQEDDSRIGRGWEQV